MFMWGWHWGWGGLASVVGSVVVLAIFVVPWFFFLLNLRGLLERVGEPNRAMQPDYVWLNFIPVFNLGWYIYTVAKVRDSVRAEYYSRGWHMDGDFGYNVGLASGVLGICSVIFGWFPVIGWGVSLAALICWVIYWLKAADLKNRLSYGGQWGSGPYPPAYGPGAPAQGPWLGGGQQPMGQQMRWSPPPPGTQSPAGDRQPPAGATSVPAGARPTPADRSPAADQQGEATGSPKNKQCAVCATSVAADDKFCRGCGLPLP